MFGTDEGAGELESTSATTASSPEMTDSQKSSVTL